MSCLRQTIRYALWGLLALVVAVGLAAVAIQAQQRLLRYRAERLLADIRALNLRQSDWSAAQALMSRWGKWGHYKGTCVEQHCFYEVELLDFAYNHSDFVGRRPWVWRLYQMIGGKPARLRAGWEVEHGRVWGKDYGVVIEVPPRRGQHPGNDEIGYSLIAEAGSVSHFPFDFQRSELLLHPDYIIGKPGGCEGCLAVYTRFTPYADAADVQRLMSFNLACLTTWRPCRVPGDIMPVPWKQYLDEIPQQESNWQRVSQCEYPLELLGRDSDDIGLFEVITSKEAVDSGQRFQIVKANLVNKLKGLQKFQAGTTQDVKAFNDAFRSTANHGSAGFASRSQWILLVGDQNFQGQKPALQVDLCGAIPATHANLDAIEHGIQLDYKASLPKDWHDHAHPF